MANSARRVSIKLIFLRVESSNVTVYLGKVIATGNPGKPAPVPISITFFLLGVCLIF